MNRKDGGKEGSPQLEPGRKLPGTGAGRRQARLEAMRNGGREDQARLEARRNGGKEEPGKAGGKEERGQGGGDFRSFWG